MPKNRPHFGFTLIELLVVIAIIGILSGIIIISISNSTASATLAKSQAFNSSLRNALMSNIAAEWKFENGTIGNAVTLTDIVDTWSTNNPTSVNSGAIIRGGSNCIYGKCLDFDGIDDYVYMGTAISNVDFTGSFTIGVWVNFHQFGDSRSSCANKRALFLRVGDSLEAGSITGLTPFYTSIKTTSGWSELSKTGQLNQWKYITLVSNSSTSPKTYKMYIDGKEEGSVNYSTLSANAGTVWIGGTTSNCSYGYFDGLVDDVRIYNTSIPTSQIRENYVAGLNKLLANGGITQQDYAERVEKLNQIYAEK